MKLPSGTGWHTGFTLSRSIPDFWILFQREHDHLRKHLFILDHTPLFKPMPTPPKSHEIIRLHIDGKKTADVQIGKTFVLFFDGIPVALKSIDSDVFVADIPLARAAVKAINDFAANGYQIRVAGSEFDFMLAQSTMSQLRTLLRSNSTDA